MGFATQDVYAPQQMVYIPQPHHSRKRDRSGSLAYSGYNEFHTSSDSRSNPSKRPCIAFHVTSGIPSSENMDISNDPPSYPTKLEPLDIGITIPPSFTPAVTAPSKPRYDSQNTYTTSSDPAFGFLSPDPFVSAVQSFPQSLLWKTGPSQPDGPPSSHHRPEHDHAPYRPKQVVQSRSRASCTVGGGLPCLLHPHRTCTPHINQWSQHQAIPVPSLPSWLSSS